MSTTIRRLPTQPRAAWARLGVIDILTDATFSLPMLDYVLRQGSKDIGSLETTLPHSQLPEELSYKRLALYVDLDVVRYEAWLGYDNDGDCRLGPFYLTGWNAEPEIISALGAPLALRLFWAGPFSHAIEPERASGGGEVDE